MVTATPFSKIWNNGSSLIKLKPKFQHVLNCKYFGWRDEEPDKNGCFQLILISPS